MRPKRTAKALLFFAFLFGCSSIGTAQNIRFEKVWGGFGKDRPFELLRTYDKGYLVCGGSANYAPNNQAFLYKFDSLGDPLWDKAYGGNGTESFKSVTHTLDSGYAAAGITSSEPSGDYQIRLVETDDQGDTNWTRTYGGSDWENLERLVTLPDSGYLMGGNSYSYGKGSSDLFLLRVDKNGDTLWTRTYGLEGYDRLHGLTLNQDSTEAYLAGERSDTGSSDTVRSFLVHTDLNGNLLAKRNYTFGERSRFHSLLEESSGELVVLAGKKDSIGDDPDMILLKFDPSGNTLFQRDFPEPAEDIGQKVVKAQDGGYAISGWTNSNGNGKRDIWLIKTSAIGFLEWGFTFGASDNERSYSLISTEDSGFATAGMTQSHGNSTRNIYLIKTDSTGFTDGNVVIGLKEEAQKAHGAFEGPSIHPNPVDEALKVRFPQKGKAGQRRVRIRTLRGILVAERVLDGSSPVHRIRTRDLPEGIHSIAFYRGGERIAARKLIVRH